MASYPTRDASAPDNHNREGQGPPRIDRSRYNSNNNRQGPETRHTEKGTPPEGKTRTAHGNLDGASNPGKRKDRSHESCARESDSGRDVKRTKIQDDPSASVNEETSRLKPSAPSVNELPNLSSSSAAAPTTSPKPSRSRPGGSILFSRALFDSVHPGSSDNETRSRRSKELQKALETAQAELTFSNLELEKSRVEKEVLEQRILALEEAKEKAHRGHLPDLEAREQQEQNDLLSRELEMKTTSVQRLTQELKESQGVIAKLRADCHLLQANANATASKKDKRIRDLLLEIDTLSGKLKTQRTESKAKSKNEPSIDVFNHRLDQVSEAQIKSGVESLNDSLDNLVTGVLEQGEQLAAHHSNLSHNFLHHDYPDTLIFLALAQHDLTQDNRGLLLDVVLHDLLHSELFDLFFLGDVASNRMDPHGYLQATIDEMTLREPWTVVQRWRAISATSVFKIHDQPQVSDSFGDHAQGIVDLLACAYGLSPSEFDPISDMLRSKLLALYQEAKDLCIMVRRDILSVRMSVFSVTTVLFDPEYADSVWPEMGATIGDEVVGRYRFGLKKLAEGGHVSCLIKPEVATTALIRETSKNGG